MVVLVLQNKAVCLYDFLLIAGGRDTNGIVADRYCGNALNPVPLAVPVGAAVGTTPVLAAAVPGGSATSVQVCSKLYRVIPNYILLIHKHWIELNLLLQLTSVPSE
jgi:hypothetical protein